MTTDNVFDRRLQIWLTEQTGQGARAGQLEAVLETTRDRRPRAGWAVALRGDTMHGVAERRSRRWMLSGAPLVVLVIAALLALVVGAVTIGTRIARPIAVGPARNGIISYAIRADRLSPPDIYYADSEGRVQAVRTGGDDFGVCSAFSPDGRELAFVGIGRGAPDGIRVAAADGSGARLLVSLAAWTDAQLPEVVQLPLTWSPDGSHLAFGNRVVSVADGSSNAVAPSGAMNPAWSPDGRRIAFTTITGDTGFNDGVGTIWVVNVDGSNPRALTSFPVMSASDAISPVSWSLDGSLLVYNRLPIGTSVPPPGSDGGVRASSQGRHVFVIGVNGGAETDLTPTRSFDVIGVAFSPDGSRIAFISQGLGGRSYDVGTVRSDGTQLATQPASSQLRGLVWSPDGTRILVTHAQPLGLPMDSMPADGNGPSITIGGSGLYEYCWPSWQRLP